MRTYQAWKGNNGVSLITPNHPQKDFLCGEQALLLYEIEAATWEEAMAIHSLRQGNAPYRPEGTPERCPGCEALYYPLGSGQCWKCGAINP